MSESEALEPLPAAVPVFPLTGAVLLPRGVLPLNIFEPRYLAMVKDAMAAEGSAEVRRALDESRVRFFLISIVRAIRVINSRN